jgi:hypothetical protein
MIGWIGEKEEAFCCSCVDVGTRLEGPAKEGEVEA